MKSRMINRAAVSIAQFAALILISLGGAAGYGQAASRYLGAITAIAGDTLTVKTDAGETHQVQVPASASLKRIAPGQRDLSTAETIQLTDLAIGDRVLVRLDSNATGATPQALQIVAIKQADVAMKQQKDREEWQRNGVGGLVKSVDAASGVVMLTSGAGATAKTVAVHIGANTILKRYAPGSVRFDEAQPAPISTIQTGDQVRARGQKNPEGTEIQAAEVVSGGFRNISGTVVSIDSAASTLTVKDLITKKPVTIHTGAETQMKRLPDTMARMIAARLKGSTTGARPDTGAGAAANAGTQPQGASGGLQQHAWSGATGSGPGAGSGAGQGPGQTRGPGGGDMQQVLNRAPAIQLGDLQKGEAVMLVSTQGATDVTAITLLAGVEPLLEAPAASQNLLSNWSMGTGGAEAAAQ
jgi:transcription antitermination factor NusG